MLPVWTLFTISIKIIKSEKNLKVGGHELLKKKIHNHTKNDKKYLNTNMSKNLQN